MAKTRCTSTKSGVDSPQNYPLASASAIQPTPLHLAESCSHTRRTIPATLLGWILACGESAKLASHTNSEGPAASQRLQPRSVERAALLQPCRFADLRHTSSSIIGMPHRFARQPVPSCKPSTDTEESLPRSPWAVEHGRRTPRTPITICGSHDPCSLNRQDAGSGKDQIAFQSCFRKVVEATHASFGTPSRGSRRAAPLKRLFRLDGGLA